MQGAASGAPACKSYLWVFWGILGGRHLWHGQCELYFFLFKDFPDVFNASKALPAAVNEVEHHIVNTCRPPPP
jgi:hypothetical protein